MLKKNIIALLGISLGGFIASLDFTIINTALPAIQSGLSLTLPQLQWVMNVFVLAIGILSATMGRFGDLFGRRLILYLGQICFAISSVMAGFSHDAKTMIFARALQGISIAMIIPCSLALIAAIFSRQQRSKVLGIWSSIRSIAMAIGPVAGGIIVSQLSWRWIFLINLPIIFFSLLLCFFTVNESRSKHEKIDWFGLLFLTLAIGLLTIAIVEIPDVGWDSFLVIALFISSILAFYIFFLIEKQATEPIIDFKLFNNTTFFVSAIVNFVILFFAYIVFFFAPLYLHTILHESVATIGIMLLPISLGMVIASSITGHLHIILKSKWLIFIGLAFFIASAYLQVNFNSNTSRTMIIIAFALMGLGWGITNVVSISMGITALPEHLGGIAAGVLSTIRNLGGSIGLAIAITIFRAEGHKELFRNLTTLGINTTQINSTAMKNFIANPVIGQQIFHGIINNNQINTLYSNAFLKGYTRTMEMLLILAFLVLILLFYLTRALKNNLHLTFFI